MNKRDVVVASCNLASKPLLQLSQHVPKYGYCWYRLYHCTCWLSQQATAAVYRSMPHLHTTGDGE